VNIYEPDSNEKYYSEGLLFIPEPKKFFPVQLIPEFVNYNKQFGAGINFLVEDYLGKHEFIARLFYDEDQVYTLKYTNRQLLPDINLEYAKTNNVIKYTDIYSETTLQNLGITENMSYYGQFKQDVINTEVLFPIFDHKIGFIYNFRNLKLKTATSFLGADTVGDDANGENGDTDEFNILRNSSVGLVYNYNKINKKTKDDSDINPRSWKFSFNYLFTYSALDEGITNWGFLSSMPYDTGEPTSDYTFHYFGAEFEGIMGVPFTKYHSLKFKAHAGYETKNVTGYDELYLGGKSIFTTFRDVNNTYLMPGYDEYSLSGETRLVGRLEYNFPIAQNISKGSFIYLDDIYITLFGDAGNVWDYKKTYYTFRAYDSNGNITYLNGPNIVYDAGIDFKIKSFIFYYTPWYTFATFAYGFQDTTPGYETSDESSEWPFRFYLGIGAGF
jgi:hypothetical protein